MTHNSTRHSQTWFAQSYRLHGLYVEISLTTQLTMQNFPLSTASHDVGYFFHTWLFYGMLRWVGGGVSARSYQNDNIMSYPISTHRSQPVASRLRCLLPVGERLTPSCSGEKLIVQTRVIVLITTFRWLPKSGRHRRDSSRTAHEHHIVA